MYIQMEFADILSAMKDTGFTVKLHGERMMRLQNKKSLKGTFFICYLCRSGILWESHRHVY